MNDLVEIAPIVISEYPNVYSSLDTKSKGFELDLKNPIDAYLAVCLGIMYAFPIHPKYADATLIAILSDHSTKKMFSIKKIAESYRSLENSKYNQRLNKITEKFPHIYEIILKHYKRIPRLIILNIAKAASNILDLLDGDITKLFKYCNYDSKEVIKTLQSWKVRLNIKAFWLCREMREQKVWINEFGNPIDGAVCCVVDIQVTRALECLGCYDKNKDIFYHSELIWKAFGELYDLPLLWLARNYCSKKNNKSCVLVKHGLCGRKIEQLSLFKNE